MQGVATALNKQLKGVIKDGGIAPSYVNDGLQILKHCPPMLAYQLRLAGFHPVDIALKCIYFTVLRQIAKWLSQAP